MDFSSDTSIQPLLMVVGGDGSSTQGIEVTSQTTGTGGTLPSAGLQPSGQGGITLLQTGAATSGSSGGQNSPMLSLCAQQWTTGPGSNPQCWNFQVLGGGNSDGSPNPQDIIQLTRTTTNATNNTTFLVPSALNIASGSITSGTNHSGQMTIGAFPSNDNDISSAYVTIVGGFTTNTGSTGCRYGNWWDVSVVHSLRGHLGEQHVSIGSLRPGSMSLGVQHRCWQDQTRLTVRGWVSEESRELSCQICNSLEVKRL